MTTRHLPDRVRATCLATLAVALPTLWAAAFFASPATAQEGPTKENTSNLQRVKHVPLEMGPQFSRSDVEIEQELSRPFVYASRIMNPTFGFDIISIEDPNNAEVIYEWRIEDAELHVGLGGMDPKYFKHDGRYYLVQSMQFAAGGPDVDLGAVVFDVTSLPDVSGVREVGRMRAPDTPGGFHNIFMYKHSSGAPLLFATTSGQHANVYDMSLFVQGDSAQGLVGRMPWPSTATPSPYGMLQGYHDFYVAFDHSTGKDMAYGAGLDGYYVYDVTDPAAPVLETSIVGVLGVQLAHTMSATPDHKYAVGQTEYLYSPVRLYDLQPGLSGEVETINEEMAVWTPNWKGFTHNHEMRWPYVFVSSFEDGLYVFNMRDPKNPSTVGYFDTYQGVERRGLDPRTLDEGDTGFNGAWGIDVRNADGLIVVSDFTTGVHFMKLDGFDGWNGADWGMPNVSSVQDWDSAPRRVIP